MAGLTVYTFLSAIVLISAHKLEQVVILSRHNIRTPLTSDLERDQLTENTWPTWKEEISFLTAKGAQMEEYMGEYIADWLRDEKLLPQDCPDDLVHIYANTRQRTRESAVAFAKGAFECNITVHSINSTEIDPVFGTVIKNNSLALKEEIVKDMQNSLDHVQLKDAYDLLENIVELEDSSLCELQNFCDFQGENMIFYEVGKEPSVIGPLLIASAIVDAFLMSYYEGFPLKEVGWGKIQTDDDWNILAKTLKENQNVSFNSTVLAKEVAKPLLDYVLSIFENETIKFALLHGHDTNLKSVMSSIGVKPHVLNNTFEATPIGGKLVFQKRSHGSSNIFQVHYVYQTTKQLREGTPLSKTNPPQWVPLEVDGCPTDKDGFCPWDDFMKIMRSLYV